MTLRSSDGVRVRTALVMLSTKAGAGSSASLAERGGGEPC